MWPDVPLLLIDSSPPPSLWTFGLGGFCPAIFMKSLCLAAEF